MSDSTQEEEHTGPIKNPKQLLLTVFFAFFVPVFAIIALVYYVVSENKPAGSMQAESRALGGVTEESESRGVAERIRKVGSVEIRDANRAMRSGEDVFKAQCTTCHATGAAGSPKFGDAAAWSARIKTGFDALVHSAMTGKGAMPAQAGGDFEDLEVARGVAYMANAAGAKFAEPQRPATADAAAVPASGTVAATTASTPVAAPVAAAAPQQVAAASAGGGEALYKQVCSACHLAGVANAPKFGDKAAWAPRIKQGMPQLFENALKGKNAMPPKGGSGAADADVRAAVEYMVNAAK